MSELGRSIIITGIILVIAGALIVFMGKIPGIGKLPGDILIERKNFTFYFPIATCILISLFLSLFFWFFGKR